MKVNKTIRLLLIGANIWYFGEGMLGPLFALFSQRIGSGILDISWAWATYLIIGGLLYIIIGNYTDTKNKALFMVFGYALNALCTFSYLLVSLPWHLFFVQAGLGIAAAFATPTWNALYAKSGDINQDGLEWGLAGGSAQIITGIALIIGGYIVNFTSFTTLFILMGTIQTIATIVQAQILKKN